ncbi:MAG: hypothetical protein DU429_02565 [Candidatus Tokpelaia sp.]|nr:MAG: hypothetical protein DU429_02565 [Candidatus Tokpelaia sp.]
MYIKKWGFYVYKRICLHFVVDKLWSIKQAIFLFWLHKGQCNQIRFLCRFVNLAIKNDSKICPTNEGRLFC